MFCQIELLVPTKMFWILKLIILISWIAKHFNRTNLSNRDFILFFKIFFIIYRKKFFLPLRLCLTFHFPLPLLLHYWHPKKCLILRANCHNSQNIIVNIVKCGIDHKDSYATFWAKQVEHGWLCTSSQICTWYKLQWKPLNVITGLVNVIIRLM